jgi:Trk K+ transport system NAD-binding subunit
MASAVTARQATRRDLRTAALYVWHVLKTFRWTLAIQLVTLVIGASLYAITPSPEYNGHPPPPFVCVYGAWMAMLGQTIVPPPLPWYLEIITGIYPLIGFVVVGEGIVRLSMLIVSKQQGEKEWMRVMASTYRDHVVLCGLGHLGYRILCQLLDTGSQVVAIEKDGDGRFIADAKATGIPVLIRDMNERGALQDAGVQHARCIIIAGNADLANIEVALDARKLNPGIRILMRVFDQQIADKLRDGFSINEAFSPNALAAPIVAAMSHEGGVLASFTIAGVTHTTAEVRVERDSPMEGKTVGEIEASFVLRVLALVSAEGVSRTPPTPGAKVTHGDLLVVAGTSERIQPVLTACRQAAA